MRLFYRIAQWLFPPKCVLCRQILEKDETDLCRHCRVHAPAAPMSHKKIPHLDRWTAVWYYEDKVRLSILRFKFYIARSYARAYGRFLAMQLLKDDMADFDLLTWVPVSKLRRLKRGYDQVELLSKAVGRELGTEPVRLLKKTRHNRPQSGITGDAARRANVLGAYRVTDPAAIRDKRILLLDDVITTGSTMSECARTLLISGVKQVNCAAVARRHEITKTSR